MSEAGSSGLGGLPLERRICRAELHLSLLQTGTDYRRFRGLPLEEFVDLIARAGLEVWYTGLPVTDSPLLPQTASSECDYDVPPDLVDRFLSRAHQHGIMVVQCFKMNRWPSVAKLHPEWLIQDIDDGRQLEPNALFLCHNTAFRQWLADFLVDRMQRHEIDGVWFDDTAYGSRAARRPWPAGCRCQSCRELYRRQSGREVPQKVDWDSKDFKLWVNWRYQNVRQFQAYITQKVRSVKSDAVVAFHNQARPSHNWQTAGALDLVDLKCHFFNEIGIMGPQMPSKLARAHRLPNCEIWYWFPQHLPNVDGPVELDPAYATLPGLIALANGVVPQATYDHFPEKQMTYSFGEFRKRRDYVGGESFKHCALHLSRQTRDFHYTREPDDYWKQFAGVAEILGQAHVITDVLFDSSLKREELAPYKLLVLPNSSCLSQEQCEAIRGWVQDGGTLLASYETSLKDELGDQRENFALADVFGVDYVGSYDRDGKSGTIYAPAAKRCEEEFGAGLALEGQHTIVRARDGATLEPLWNLSSRTTVGLEFGRAIYNARMHDSGHPGVTCNPVGKGKAIYVSVDVGTAFHGYPTPRIRRFMAGLAARAPAAITVEAPSRFEITAFWRGQFRLLVHLYQRWHPALPWQMEVRPMFFALDEPFPVHGIKLHLRGLRVKTARMPLQNLRLEPSKPQRGLPGGPPPGSSTEASQDAVTLQLPPVYLHEVIELELDRPYEPLSRPPVAATRRTAGEAASKARCAEPEQRRHPAKDAPSLRVAPEIGACGVGPPRRASPRHMLVAPPCIHPISGATRLTRGLDRGS